MTFIHDLSEETREELRERFHEDPRSVLEVPEQECERLQEELVDFYRQHLEETPMEGYALGLSGGVDSATVAYLLTEAVGPSNVTAVLLPADHTPEEDVEDAVAVAEELGLETNDYERFRSEVDDVVDTLAELGRPVEEGQQVKRGNILARCRMTVLRDIAKADEALVAGTTNASERFLGYTTLAADGLGGVDNEGLFALFKTTVRDLATYLGVPDRIVEKTPRADLWEGQSDADEIGFSYTVLDQVLAGLRLGLDLEAVAECVEGIDLAGVEQVRKRVERYRFKNRPGPHPSFS
ncbi:MAG: NAD(+) synthase [Candidatus Nanohaloarchaea archaeon]|nr:NAD(+) synthase [Candidatus Nanohaloarchaea archaeon]